MRDFHIASSTYRYRAQYNTEHFSMKMRKWMPDIYREEIFIMKHFRISACVLKEWGISISATGSWVSLPQYHLLEVYLLLLQSILLFLFLCVPESSMILLRYTLPELFAFSVVSPIKTDWDAWCSLRCTALPTWVYITPFQVIAWRRDGDCFAKFITMEFHCLRRQCLSNDYIGIWGTICTIRRYRRMMI